MDFITFESAPEEYMCLGFWGRESFWEFVYTLSAFSIHCTVKGAEVDLKWKRFSTFSNFYFFKRSADAASLTENHDSLLSGSS